MITNVTLTERHQPPVPVERIHGDCRRSSDYLTVEEFEPGYAIIRIFESGSSRSVVLSRDDLRVLTDGLTRLDLS